MSTLLKLHWTLVPLVAFLAFSVPGHADPDPFAGQRAKAESICHDVKKKTDEDAAKAQQIPDAGARAQALQRIGEVQKLVADTEAAISKGPEKLGISPREYNERLLGVARSGNWQLQKVEQQSFGTPPSAAARVTLPSRDDFVEKVSRGFDGARSNYTPGASDSPVIVPQTEFFKVQGAFRPTDRSSAVEIDKHDGHTGGGVMLEGVASGLGTVDGASVEYDPALNAITFNGNLVYFLKVAPWNAQALCREIADDPHELVGVTMTVPRFLVFGANGEAIYHDTEVAYDLVIADGFLGDIVFNQDNWNLGYKYPAGFKPQSSKRAGNRLVRWAFGDFAFTVAEGKVQLAGAHVEARIIPIGTTLGPQGEFHPDQEKLANGYLPPAEEVSNIRHIVENIAYYRQERIIDRMFIYGETAAFLRALKQAGTNMNRLASAME